MPDTEYILTSNNQDFEFKNLDEIICHFKHFPSENGSINKIVTDNIEGKLIINKTKIADIEQKVIFVNAYSDLEICQYYEHKLSLMTKGKPEKVPLTKCLYIENKFFTLNNKQKFNEHNLKVLTFN